MIRHVDWLLIKGYFRSYLVCLVSLLSLYVVIDLFSNIDDFAGKRPEGNPAKRADGSGAERSDLKAILRHIGLYYGYRSSKIFDQLCEPVVLLAAMFTVAWIQRNNELMPLLSAGVSTRRVVRPVLVSAWIMLSFAALNAELVIPRIASQLSFDKDDPEGKKEIQVKGAWDSNNLQIDGRIALREGLLVKGFNVTVLPNVSRNIAHVSATEARYIPAGSTEGRSGGWLLTGATPPTLENWDHREVLDPIDPGKYFLTTRDVDFEVLTRNPKWFQLASTLQLYGELQRPDASRVAQMAVLFHTRLTRPLLGIVLVLMGLSVILTDQNRHMFISAGICVLLCGLFFGAVFAAKQLGDADIVSPALAAWLPVLLFGPLSLVMFDAVHT